MENTSEGNSQPLYVSSARVPMAIFAVPFYPLPTRFLRSVDQYDDQICQIVHSVVGAVNRDEDYEYQTIEPLGNPGKMSVAALREVVVMLDKKQATPVFQKLLATNDVNKH